MEPEQGSRTLKLWQAAVEEMRRSGVTHGSVYEARWFEQRLSCSRGSLQFDSAMHDIRAELENDGFFLSPCDYHEDRFVILAPESNLDRMLAYQRGAVESLRRAVVLGANTQLHLLSDSRRRRHEATLERIAKRAALVGRCSHVL